MNGGGMDEQRERELKFDVPDDWAVPNLDPLAESDGDVQVETIQLQTTYFDTVGRDLLAHGMTLRRRIGDADVGWQLKVPEGDARTELRVPLGNGTAVPRDLRDLLVAVRAGSPLRRAARLDTTRTVHRVLAASGPVLEVADDSVQATAFGEAAVLSEWREAEIELVNGSEQDLGRAEQLLTKTGAVPAQSSSKLARALNYARPPVPPPPDESLGALVRTYLTTQYDVLIVGDIDLRRGHDVVHPVRVATRRFRSALRAFHGAFEAGPATALEGELRWYAGLLGAVRDHQVLRTHLDDLMRTVPDDAVSARGAARLTRVLDREDAQARADLAQAMAGRRYLAMIRDLRACCDAPPLVDAERPAGDAVTFVEAAQRREGKRMRKWSEDGDDDEAMHDARKAAKRLRYAAELAGPVLGKQGRKIRKHAKQAQQRLGAAQDGVGASAFLRQVASEGAGGVNTGFGLGVLWSAEQHRLRTIRSKALRKFG